MFRTLFLLCCVLVLSGCWSSAEPGTEEKRLLLTDEDFRADGIETGGSYSKVTLYVPTGSSELTFTSNKSPDFWLRSTFSTSATPAEAVIKTMAYDALRGQELALKGDYGLRAKLLLLMSEDGRPIGNAFFFTSGKKSFHAIFKGIYFPDAESFEAFIAPKVVAVKAFEVEHPLVILGRDLVEND